MNKLLTGAGFISNLYYSIKEITLLSGLHDTTYTRNDVTQNINISKPQNHHIPHQMFEHVTVGTQLANPRRCHNRCTRSCLTQPHVRLINHNIVLVEVL
jgi:hypothetical protein